MIEWAKLQEIDGYIIQLDLLIDELKKDIKIDGKGNGNCVRFHFISDLYISLNNVEKIIYPEFTPGKPPTQQELINCYWGSNPNGLFILDTINNQRKRIGELYLKEYILTLNNLPLLEAKTVIINELSLIKYRKIVLESGGSELSDWSNSLKKHLKIILKNLNQIPIETITSKNKTGFKTSLSDKEIDNLYPKMQGNYIAAEPHQFKAIFKDEPLPPDFKAIKLLKKFSTVLCAYFVSELFQKENPLDYWSIAENCFDVKNLKQSLNNAYKFNSNGKPRGHDKIDTILKTLHSPLQ